MLPDWARFPDFGKSGPIWQHCIPPPPLTRAVWLRSTDPGPHQPPGREALRGRRLPQCLREDQPGHDEAVPARVEGGVRGRRHRLDEVRQPG